MNHNNNNNMNGSVDMAVTDPPDGSVDPTKDMTGMTTEDMTGMSARFMTTTVGLPCVPGTYCRGAGPSVEIW